MFKFCMLTVLILSTALSIHIKDVGGDFDIVKEIYQLQAQNRRDDALDLIKTFGDSNSVDQDELKKLEKDLEYTTPEKIKSVVWNGALKGEVYDKYSGLGAISGDFVIFGDIRDIGVQSWHYLIDRENFDGIVMLLACAGIGLSSVTFANGCNALAKNTVKYLKRVPALSKKGMVKRFLKGKMSVKESEKIWSLLKKNNWSVPRTVTTLANVNNIKELDIAADIISSHKITGNAFIYLNGSKCLNLYASLPNRLKHTLIKGFNKNPRAIIGLTKSHMLIHSIKILKKYGLNALVIPVSMFALFLAMLPEPLIWFIFIASSLYLLITPARIIINKLRKKEKT